MSQVLFFLYHECGVFRLEMDYASSEFQSLSQKSVSISPENSSNIEIIREKIVALDFLILKNLNSFSRDLSKFYNGEVWISDSKFLFKTSILEEVTDIDYSIISKMNRGDSLRVNKSTGELDSNHGNVTLPRLSEHEKMIALNPLY